MNKASGSPLRLVTPRDRDLFQALDRCPLTVRQLLKLSVTFAYPFTTERRVQERLQHLCAAGRVRRWRYATAGQGALSYYTLTRLSHALLHGDEAAPPPRGAFAPVGLSRQPHTQALADVFVHLFVCARAAGIRVEDYKRENLLRLHLEGESLFPDGAFRLVSAGQAFAFFLELDNSTESIRSQTSLDSWQRKVRFYERYQDAKTERFRVLAVTTGGEPRIQNLLGCAASLARNPQRSLIYGIRLDTFLADPDAVTAACFKNHRSEAVALVQVASDARTLSRSDNGNAADSVVASAPCRVPLPQV